MHPMFIAALFTIAKTWKQPKCPSTDEWIKMMWYVYTMEYYSAIKKNEIMQFAATWVTLGEIMLNEISQSQKRQILYEITYMRYLEQSNSLEQKVEWWLPGTGEKRNGELLFNGYSFSFAGWKSSGAWLHNNVDIFNTIEL